MHQYNLIVPPNLFRQFYKQYGVVSGGLYDSKEGCSPYPFPPCNHIYNTSLESNREKMKFCGKPNVYSNTPKCTRTCEAGYTVPYASDKHFAYFYYKFTSTPLSYRVLSIMSEIYISGSVTASFTFYDDLFFYKSGKSLLSSRVLKSHIHQCLNQASITTLLVEKFTVTASELLDGGPKEVSTTGTCKNSS